MGLGFSHGDAHWAYSGFNFFRVKLAKEIGICLYLMEGFWVKESYYSAVERTFRAVGADVIDKHFNWLPETPLKWGKINDPIVPLLCHSDCEGSLTISECKKIWPRLEELILDWPEEDYDKQQGLELIDGMKDAIKEKKKLKFC